MQFFCNILVFWLCLAKSSFIFTFSSINRYEKSCVEGSINIPYSGVHLGQHELLALGPFAERTLKQAMRAGKVVIVASVEDETAQLVSFLI